jgi:predicted RNA-binding Zn-ribbon protein involved in translation (DUF1610 family)
MFDPNVPTAETICPVCGRSMIFLHEIRRAVSENLYVWQCKPCDFSMTGPASWTTQPDKFRVSLPKIPSAGIGGVRQNQRIIGPDAFAPSVVLDVNGQPVQVALSA